MRTFRTKTILALAIMALAILAGQAQAGIVQPTGTNPATGQAWAPGDEYRLAFVGSVHHDALWTDIADYNAFIQGLADAAGLSDATWNIIGSTSLVDARDNTSTNPNTDGVGEPILLMDGSTIVANNYADLWDGEIAHIINQTETGGPPTSHLWAFTGTYLDGTVCDPALYPTAGHGLDASGEVAQGFGGDTTQWIWRQWTSDPAATVLPMYGMSEKLTVVPEPSTFVLAALGLFGLVGFVRRRRK